MLDAQNAVAAPAAIRREDYRPPEWLVPEISLDFELDAERTIVRAILEVERNGPHAAPLRLETGEGTLRSLRIDGNEGRWRSEEGALLVDLDGTRHSIETVSEINPKANTK